MRTVFIGLFTITSVACLELQGARAETAHKGKRSTPAHTSRSEPDITATIAKQPPHSAPTAPAFDDNEIPPPYKLPTASRARVRSCGETWRNMKLAGTTQDDDWRDFALKCLASKDALPSGR